MALLGAKVSRSEVSSILKNTFLVQSFWWNRPHTSFLGLIGYMVRSGTKLFRTKTVLNFASKALSNSFFQKTRFRLEFLYQIAPHEFYGPNGLDARDWGQKSLGAKFRPSQKTRFQSVFFDETGPLPLFWAKLAIWCIPGQNCSGRKHCPILPQKPSQIRFSKKHVFGLNFCTKSHLTYFLGQTD